MKARRRRSVSNKPKQPYGLHGKSLASAAYARSLSLCKHKEIQRQPPKLQSKNVSAGGTDPPTTKKKNPDRRPLALRPPPAALHTRQEG